MSQDSSIYPQTPLGCGGHNVCVIARAFGKDSPNRPFSFFERLSGLTTPQSLKQEIRGLGLKAGFGTANRWNAESLQEVLSERLPLGPVILLVKASEWIPIPHWISIWRMDGETCFIYDSFPTTVADTDLDIGNATATVDELVRRATGWSLWPYQGVYLTVRA